MYSVKIDKGIFWLNFFLNANYLMKIYECNVILIKMFVFRISSGTKCPIFLFEHVSSLYNRDCYTCSACLYLQKLY